MLGGMYGGGLGGMYGGGIYGSGLGGMCGSGLGGMYGGGLGGMYGGGMDSMYSGGLGMSGGGYMRQRNQYSTSSGLGNRGFSSSSAFNTAGDGIEDNQSSVGGGLNHVETRGVASSPISGGGSDLSCLPGAGNGASRVRSGIPVCDAPPPLHETPEEKVKRLRKEARQEMEMMRQKKEKREQLRRQARVEIAGHVTNVVGQTLRSVLEVCTVCFASYYSIKSFKQMAQMPYMARNGSGGMLDVAHGKTISAARTVVKSSKGGTRWKLWIAISIFLFVAELLYHKLIGKRNSPAITQEKSRVELLLNSDDESEENELLSSNLKDAWESTGLQERGRHTGMFVAVHDYECEDGEGYLNFKAGDKFLIEDFSDNKWCMARRVDGDNISPSGSLVGYVPSNFLRSLEQFTKL